METDQPCPRKDTSSIYRLKNGSSSRNLSGAASILLVKSRPPSAVGGERLDWTDEQLVAALCCCCINTVERTRRRFIEAGPGCLNERPRRGQARKLTGKQKAHLIAVACGTPPTGRARWTLSLLADKVRKRWAHS